MGYLAVNGDREIVEAICDHPGIEAISFVVPRKWQESTAELHPISKDVLR
jgi:hypothetical protein